MTSVGQLITTKGQVVHTVSHDTPMLKAVAQMVGEDVGCVVVLRDGGPCGILTVGELTHYIRGR